MFAINRIERKNCEPRGIRVRTQWRPGQQLQVEAIRGRC